MSHVIPTEVEESLSTSSDDKMIYGVAGRDLSIPLRSSRDDMGGQRVV
jgi:hypothetical protein